MLSRRRFIESGVAGTLAGALTAWRSPAEAAAGSAIHGGDPRAGSPLESSGSPRAGAVHRMPLHAAVFDERFAEAARFAAEAHRLGLPVRGVRGDVTDLWYAELHPLWKRQARPIAGLTPYAALFCLERLAWDHGMRVVYHGEHARLADGRIEHVLQGPVEAAGTAPTPRARAAPGERADWPTQIASLIAQAERRSSWVGLPPARRAVEARFLTPALPLGQGTARGREQRVGQSLHSWVIAPPARAVELALERI